MSRATLFLLLLGICSFGHAQLDNSVKNVTINETKEKLMSNETNDPYRMFRLPYLFPDFFEPEIEKPSERIDEKIDTRLYYPPRENKPSERMDEKIDTRLYYPPRPFWQQFFPDLFGIGNLTERTGIIVRNGKPCSTRIIIRTITQNIQEKPKRYRKMDNLAMIFPHLKWIMLLLFIWIVFALIGIGTLRKVNAKIVEAKSRNDPTQRC